MRNNITPNMASIIPHNNDYMFNAILATCISSIVFSLGQTFNTLIASIFVVISTFMVDKFSYIKNKFYKVTGEIIIEGKKINQLNGVVRMDLPMSYKAVMDKLIDKNISLESITELPNDNQIRGNMWMGDTPSSESPYKKFIILNNKNPKIELDKNIFVAFYRSSNYVGTQRDLLEDNYTIIMTSYIYDANYLSKYLDVMTKEYISKVKIYDDGNIYYINQNNSDKNYDMHIMKTHKTFDNMFFEQKSKVLKKINYFLSNEKEYAKKGIPYTLGLLLYGEPGCGKTSCIKALADLTKRHILEINLKNINTCTEFVEAFRNDTYNGLYIPVEKKIIVLEDIDCMTEVVSRKDKNIGDTEIIESENKTDSEQESKSESEKEDKGDDKFFQDGSNFIRTDGSSSKKKNNLINVYRPINNYGNTKRVIMPPPNQNKKKKSKDKLTLSCILNTLDGVLEQHGRIIIITTNYLDRLDSALIRPGRIDEKIHFTKCTKQMYYNIIENFYGITLPKDIEFIENKYSPAEVLEKCISNFDDPDDLIPEIIV
jgi:AAA+ superfamily predicted ATPase